jgi:ankyrin repeat protein
MKKSHEAKCSCHQSLYVVLLAVLLLAAAKSAICGEIHDAAGARDLKKLSALLKDDPGLISSKEPDHGLTALHIAALKGYRDVAELLLANGANVNIKDNSGMTPLHIAAGFGNKDVVQLLLANKADLNASDNLGRTPLHMAAKCSDERLAGAVADSLVAKGADVGARDDDGDTPLWTAVVESNWEVAKLLLANKADIDAKDNDGDTILHFATIKGYKEVIEFLLAHKANMMARTKGGMTPLHLAAGFGKKDIVELLLAKKADINATDDDGRTPLHAAAKMGEAEIVKLLLSQGANINVKNEEGQTALDLAKAKGYKDVVALLGPQAGGKTRSNDSIDVQRHQSDASEEARRERPQETGQEKILQAIENGDLDNLRQMLQRNPSLVSSKDADGRTPLHWATEKATRKEVFELLLTNGANVNAKDKDGRSPLAWAAMLRRDDVADLFLDHSADLNTRDKDGMTPLHLAALFGQDRLVRSLLMRGADVNSRDDGDATPLHWAALKGNTAVVEVLVASGADVNAKDKKGRTPLAAANANQHSDVAQFLVAHGAATAGASPSGVAKSETHGDADLIRQLAGESAETSELNPLPSEGPEPQFSDTVYYLDPTDKSLKRLPSERGMEVIKDNYGFGAKAAVQIRGAASPFRVSGGKDLDFVVKSGSPENFKLYAFEKNGKNRAAVIRVGKIRLTKISRQEVDPLPVEIARYGGSSYRIIVKAAQPGEFGFLTDSGVFHFGVDAR